MLVHNTLVIKDPENKIFLLKQEKVLEEYCV